MNTLKISDSDYISITALNHYFYCSHRCWRMFCAGEFVDNQYTIEGTGLHQLVHTVGTQNRQEIWQVRAVWLKSEQYRLIGKADLIEEANGQLYPVEYKRGKTGQWDNDELQVCAQALCLEEMTGKPITMGYLYYSHSHQRKPVPISEELRKKAIATIQAIVNMFDTGIVPLAVYSPRCKGCSFYSQCLPQAINKVRAYQEQN